ncbi:DUF5723 family protein [Marinilabilia rubra]|uniref:Flagellar motor protein MotB n=1 Tax=Marinilabilia rubra TaxID=2162893 RepID=A0A2U2BEF3_9BACT|nr:DUF5723 family protein [Marinilabilia rubra]PWE01441.1 flagellar motor protein MotB [Marinilabilia rubra]
MLQKIAFFLILYLFQEPVASGQSPMGLYFPESLPQTSRVNPAHMPDKSFYITLPSPSVVFQMNPSFNAAVQRDNNEWISPLHNNFDYPRLYQSAGNVININAEAGLSILGFGFKTGNQHFGVSLSVKNASQVSAPSDALRITEKGFPHNSFFDFSKIHIKQVVYKEVALTYARKWNENLSLGVSIKPLFGIAGAVSNIRTLSLHTSRVVWQGDVDATLNASGPVELEQSALEDIPDSYSIQGNLTERIPEYLTSWKNAGVGFDLGAKLETDGPWTFSASLIDLGWVRFKNELTQMSFKGSYSYDGIERDGFDEQQLDNHLDELVDTLNQVLDYNVSNQPFSAVLTPKLYAGAAYQLRHNLKAGFLSRTTFQKKRWNQEFNTSLNYRPRSWLELNAGYSFRINGSNGPGGTLVIGNSPLQFFIAADYLPPRYAMVTFDDYDPVPVLHKQRDLSFQFGINLKFDKFNPLPKKAKRRNPQGDHPGAVPCPKNLTPNTR